MSQQENALMAVNDKLTAAQQDNQKLRFQLDDAVRQAADEQERSGTQHLLLLHINTVVCFSQDKQPLSLLLASKVGSLLANSAPVFCVFIYFIFLFFLFFFLHISLRIVVSVTLVALQILLRCMFCTVRVML